MRGKENEERKGKTVNPNFFFSLPFPFPFFSICPTSFPFVISFALQTPLPSLSSPSFFLLLLLPSFLNLSPSKVVQIINEKITGLTTTMQCTCLCYFHENPRGEGVKKKDKMGRGKDGRERWVKEKRDG